MVSPGDIYKVLEATVPLYVAMLLAYLSFKWWKIFTLEQCSGINKFVAKFSVPLLSFHVISTSNPYTMNVKLVISDTIQKVIAILVFGVVGIHRSKVKLDWIITGFSLSTLPNTLIVGIPLIKGMYGEDAAKLLGQIVVLQTIIWYTLLLIMFELRAARVAIRNSQHGSTDVTIQGTEFREELQTQNDGDREMVRSPHGNDNQTVLAIVWWKLIKNPNTHASLFGLAWALISFRWEIHLPLIVSGSISILSDGGLGMAMFSLGLFMASQTKIIACGMKMATLAMVIRFLVGPAMMAIASYAIGLRGTMLNIAIIQAALPQGIVPFVFAKEYNLHPAILSTGIFLGMILAVPIALAYYFLLEL